VTGLAYAVIGNDGQLHIRDTDWRSEVGPEGPVRVALDPRWRLAGWVNDCGLLDQATYPRNVVGSVLLHSLGAAHQPYAGPVVITGWDPPPGGEVQPLGALAEISVTELHANVRRALGLNEGDATMPPEWVDAARELADMVRTAPSPRITVLGGDW
jgi:hypothetical protein